jgi:subtilase family serine protease
MGHRNDLNIVTIIIIIVLIIVLIFIIIDYCRKRTRSNKYYESNENYRSTYSNNCRFSDRKSDKRFKTRADITNDVTSGITMNPHFRVVLDQTNNRPLASLQSFAGYTPSEIRNAYGLSNIPLDGTGQIIAIVDAYTIPTILSDFQTFDSTFNIGTPNNLTVVPLGTESNKDWGLESSLDVQWVHAIAPGAQILLVQAADASLEGFNQAIKYAITHGATVVSMSWGTPEYSGEAVFDEWFSANNVIFAASSGDSGGETNWPSVSSSVVSVGGTSLNLSTVGSYVGETGWSDGGGGASVFTTIPPWQKSYGLKGNRQTPDISCIADPKTGVPVYDSFGYMGQTGWFEVGGTSLSSPIMAGIFALANQGRIVIGKQTLTNTLFQNYLYNTKNSSSFNDITIGNAGLNSCKPGYDNITGLGTPINTSMTSGFIADLINLP